MNTKRRERDTFRRAVEQGGGVYVGIQRGVVSPEGKQVTPDLVLFNSKETGSTLALPTNRITPEAVRRHIAESNAKFLLASA
jgi:hypothetical protein